MGHTLERKCQVFRIAGVLHSLYSNFATAMDKLKSLFLGVQFKDKDQVFNILEEEGVSGDYKGTLFKRHYQVTPTRFV